MEAIGAADNYFRPQGVSLGEKSAIGYSGIGRQIDRSSQNVHIVVRTVPQQPSQPAPARHSREEKARLSRPTDIDTNLKVSRQYGVLRSTSIQRSCMQECSQKSGCASVTSRAGDQPDQATLELPRWRQTDSFAC